MCVWRKPFGGTEIKQMLHARSVVVAMQDDMDGVLACDVLYLTAAEIMDSQLDGIMIATTNLQQNMDKAFERRFLYKIKFDKPTEEARASIWHSMIPELSELEVHTLASKYDFSGGQIENIARHYAIDTILHGQSEDVLPMLIRHCDNERLDETNVKKIGF